MTVLIVFKDATTYRLAISDVIAQTFRGPADAISFAKRHLGATALREMEAKGIDRWEVEDEFLQ